MISNLILVTVFLIGANCLYLPYEHNRAFQYNDLELEEPIESNQPVHIRERRQLHGAVITNSDGTADMMAKLPLTGNNKNMLSAVGGVQGLKPDLGLGAISGGLALDNVNGNGITLTGKHIPDFGNQLKVAGNLNLVHTDKQDLSANAFAARNFPNNPAIPNFNTFGAGLDYMYNNKVGASLGISHTPFLQKTDYSALGKLNLFHNPLSSFDFSAGLSKSVSPFMPKSSWQPNFGFSYSRYF